MSELKPSQRISTTRIDRAYDDLAAIDQAKTESIKSLLEQVTTLQTKCDAYEKFFNGAKLSPYRSGGFINKECDMGVVSIELPIIEANKLMQVLSQWKGE